MICVRVFALDRKPIHNHGAVHQVVTCTSEREVYALLLGRVEDQRALPVALP